MTASDLEAAEQALMAGLTAALGTLTPDKAAAFFPGIAVDDQVVQNGAVNTLRLAQWLATFDTTLVLRPGQAETTAPPGGTSATAIYSAIVTGARAVDPGSLAGQQLTRRILADKTLLEQVALDAPLGWEPPDWPLPSASAWQTASTARTRPPPDPADPANTVVRLPSLGDIPDGSEVTIVNWEKAVGDPVEAGQVLAEAETVKVDAEIPSPAAGTLLAITAPVDAIVKTGDPIAIVGPGQPAPPVTIEYQYALVSLTRRASGTPWWDDVLISDPTWFIPGRAAGGLLPAPPAGRVNALPYALLVVRNVVVASPGPPPGAMTRLGPVLVSEADGAGDAALLGRAGPQAVALVANVLPPLPPKADPA